MQTADSEVVIGGGGPAGAVAALLLARAGRRVIVVEQTPHPRDKTCGDLLGTEAVRRLRALRAGEDALRAAFPLAGAVLHGPGGRRYGAPAGRPGPAGARVVRRRILDAALLGEALAAGARLLNARALGLERAADGTVGGLRTTAGVVRAPVTIGADGWGSAVARGLGVARPPAAHTAIVARAYAYDAPATDGRMHFFVNRPGDGYAWIFPLGDGAANVGLGFICGEDDAANAAGALVRFRTAQAASGLLAGANFRDERTWPIPLGWRAAPVAAPGALLAGDAASLASPLSGSGIHHAVASAAYAAAAAEETLRGDAGAWRRYARTLRDRFAARLHAETWLHRYASTAVTVDRCAAAFTALPGGHALLSRAMLALG